MTFIIFVLVLGAVVLVHEFGHFINAKIFKTYVYEFSIGMGKRLWYFKKKGGETEYSIRLFPIGGFVRLAGEEVDDDKKIPKNRKLWAKSFWQRFLIMFAGAGFNFIFAILLLFIIGISYGSVSTKPIIGSVSKDYPSYEAGLRDGDTILSIDNVNVKTWDDMIWELTIKNGKETTFKVKDTNGNIKEIKVNPIKEVKEKEESYVYGISRDTTKYRGFSHAIDYTVTKTKSLFTVMFKTIGALFTGGVSVKDLSGPVGIYSIVDTQSKAGFESLLYLVAFLSINVGVINLIPFPAFDGGRILFLIIEKIKGKPVDPKVENTIHSIGFFLLLTLIIYVTFNDILRLFG